ncbi:YqzL family protein [Paenibacillus lutrae]|uniref:YqzL family protein n=1 Tax=Paenibacillus lutrae TaxID=2078573 RepID=A0A7X3FGX7_9BACL|nr:YqzL family protein [Paenibacillus lutrae]MVO99417.1 YqzL family protein [Paenibacillus lutrae]
MRDFTWQYFCTTGDVDAYMLYKDLAPSPDTGAEESETFERMALEPVEA